MGSEIESLEERLKSFLGQLQTESGIFERMMYKNKNQHRRCFYFQYLLKVRRDLRLLESAKLEQLVASCFHVITQRKPKQAVHLLESLKWRKSDSVQPNFMERLLGAARLLSEMVEPILKAAIEVSILLGRSFFIRFCQTILALLARLRVLVQQILLDVVSVFNMVSSLSQKKLSVKISQEGVEVFREYYPTNKQFVTLECVWKTDKFVLFEKTHISDVKSKDEYLGDGSAKASALRYRSIESFLGDDDSNFENEDAKESSAYDLEEKKDTFASPLRECEHSLQVEGGGDLGDNLTIAGAPNDKIPRGGGLHATSSPSPSSKPLLTESSAKQVAFLPSKRPAPSTAAFVSVKKPATSTVNVTDIQFKENEKECGGKKDSFFDLFAGGNLKDSLF